MSTLNQWLTDESPETRWQASMGRSWRLLRMLMKKPAGPVLVGAVSGYFGGWVDKLLISITDVFLSIPKLILALVFVAALGPGIENAIIAISITAWPVYARIARAKTKTFLHRNSSQPRKCWVLPIPASYCGMYCPCVPSP